MSVQVGVLGCGWLGFPLAKSLHEKGNRVRGATRSKDQLERIQKSSIIPFFLNLEENTIKGNLEFFSELDVLIIALPPGIRNNPEQNFANLISTLIQTICEYKIPRIVFISSISVYGNQKGKVTEDNLTQPETSSGKQLLECERLLMNRPEFQTLIFRFGGLIGKGRHPIYSLSSRKSIPNPEGLINFIHLEDCIGMIETALGDPQASGIYNGVSPSHPTRKEYYKKMADLAKINLPPFENSKKDSKRISVEKFQRKFLYTFIVENLLTLK